MTLRVAQPTQESVDLVRSHLSELAGRPQFRSRALARANPLELALAVPHDVYFLGLGDLADGGTLAAAKPVGRRFLVMSGDEAVASAELAGSDGSTGQAFQANEGPFVSATAAAIASAEQDPRLAAGDYEVRVLRIPALYFMALWLKDNRGDGDVLVPLAPAPPPFDAGHTYPPQDVLPVLVAQARQRRQSGGEAGG